MLKTAGGLCLQKTAAPDGWRGAPEAEEVYLRPITHRLSGRAFMKLSARNVFKGRVVKVTKGAVNSVVVVEIGTGIRLTSVVTSDAVQELRLAKGKEAYAIIKAPNVMLGVDE
jgi:molybdopterin-binding protein